MIAVVLDHDEGSVLDTSWQAATFARGLGEPVGAVAFGDGAAQALEAAAGDWITAATHVLIEGYAPAAWARVLADLDASAVVAAGTDRGNELLAHLGARISAPFAANCVAAERDGDGWIVTRQRWGGSLLEDARLHGSPALFSVAPHAVAAAPVHGGTPAPIEEVSAVVDDLDVRATRVEASTDAAVSLGEASIVVGGGRGVGSAEGFAALDALAAALGGVVGVSRAVTSAGWRPHAEQIGQTGERIAPDLYIACGISGASQHMVGCRGAKRLLAINSDPDAPILARSDFGVIGDLHEVVPAIVAELERRRA